MQLNLNVLSVKSCNLYKTLGTDTSELALCCITHGVQRAQPYKKKIKSLISLKIYHSCLCSQVYYECANFDIKVLKTKNRLHNWET